ADARDAPQVIGARPRQPVQSADRVEHRVGQLEGAGPGNAVPQDDREQLVVAQPAHADALELFTRAIVRRNGLHRTSSCCYTFRSWSVARLPSSFSCWQRLAVPSLPRKKSTRRSPPSISRAAPAPTGSPPRNTARQP